MLNNTIKKTILAMALIGGIFIGTQQTNLKYIHAEEIDIVEQCDIEEDSAGLIVKTDDIEMKDTTIKPVWGPGLKSYITLIICTISIAVTCFIYAKIKDKKELAEQLNSDVVLEDNSLIVE